MKPVSPKRQRGAALLALLAVLVLGGAWYLVSRLSAASGDFTAANRKYNAAVLSQAKRALIGHVALQAAKQGEDNPGRFPCPEASGNVGGPLEGAVAGNCTLPAVGRLPWRTMGLEKLLDASGEPLWYVVSPGWALSAGTAPPLTTYINSNALGQLNVDGPLTGTANDVVALIIAPGPAMNVQASSGCAARNQSRSAPSSSINPLDYLECFDTTTLTFSTAGPGASFNDQVIKITAAEVLPAIETAIADRFQHEFAPQIRAAYSGGLWPATPVLPFAVTFSNPTTSPANKLQGSAAITQGLLPASYAYTGPCTCGPTPCVCTPAAACTAGSDPRCDPAFVSWQAAATTIIRTGGANLESYSCSASGTPTTLTCTLRTYTDILSPIPWMTFTLAAKANNIGMVLRQVNATVPITGVDTGIGAVNPPYGYAISSGSTTMNNDGSATLTMSTRLTQAMGSPLDFVVGGLLCSVAGLLCYENTVSVPMVLLGDHPIVDPSNSTYNWFYRNKWHEVSYYAVAPGIAPSGARSCTTAGTCLQVTHHPNDGKPRGLLVIAGRKLGAQARPATALTDLFEGANAGGASPFELRSVTLMMDRSFNDRFAIIDANP